MLISQKLRAAIVLTKVILKICTFSIKKTINLIFGMGGDANVKLCIQHFLTPGLSPTLLGNLF
jgi:hypothetical protein